MIRGRLLLPVLLVGGCAYYNGMYNTDRLAGRARKAEREGRSSDAISLWSQVAVRAESILIRHPSEGWSDRARLLQGTALVKTGDCRRALGPLESLMTTAPNPQIAEPAALLVGGCRLELNDPEGATAAYDRVRQSQNAGRRSLALYYHGRALRTQGRYEEALDELTRSSEPGARGERAAALAGMGRLAEALTIVDSLFAGHDTLAPWEFLVAAVAAQDAEAASTLADRVAVSDFPAGLGARVMLADAERWVDRDAARGARRLAKADSLAQGTPVQGEAHLRWARRLLSDADSLPALARVVTVLSGYIDDPEPYGSSARALAQVARRLLLVADSVPAGAPRGDLQLFVAGELARDSLGAPDLAAAQFRRIAVDWPGSPFAPKAMLALITLQPATSDSLREVLLASYADNPYVLLAGGSDSPGYQALEDSLQRFATDFHPAARPPPLPGNARPGQPAAPTPPANN
ncbi:MAG TPA: hypothetical protein VH879_16050 [Gemmatimonadales bacterium]